MHYILTIIYHVLHDNKIILFNIYTDASNRNAYAERACPIDFLTSEGIIYKSANTPEQYRQKRHIPPKCKGLIDRNGRAGTNGKVFYPHRLGASAS